MVQADLKMQPLARQTFSAMSFHYGTGPFDTVISIPQCLKSWLCYVAKEKSQRLAEPILFFYSY